MTTPTGLTGWIDYDRPNLKGLPLIDRIDYFERRVRLVLINPLKRILDTEIHAEKDSSALLIFGVSLSCAIEASGKFLSGGGLGNGARFKRFVEDYMNPDFYLLTLNGQTYGDILWVSFRNGLAHGFAVCHGGFEERGTYFDIKSSAGVDTLIISPFKLYDDYVAGFEKYLAALRASGPGDALYDNFDAVFTSVFVQGN